MRRSLALVSVLLGALVPEGMALSQQPISPPVRSGFPVTLAGSGAVVTTQPAVGDLDNDGVKEIVVGTKGRKLYVLNANGTVRAGWPVTLPAEVVGSPAIGRIDADAFPDVVVTFKGTTDPTGKGGARAYRRDGGLIWEKLTATDNGEDGVYASPAIGDLDGDGQNEAVFGSFDFRVYAIRPDGSSLSGWPYLLRDTTFSSAALFDLEGDGKLEVIVGVDTHAEGPPHNTPDGGALYVIRWNGQVYPGFPVFTDQTMQSSPAVGDIDGDGKPEIVVGGGVFYPGNVGKKVHAFRCDGSVVTGWPVSVDAQVFESPALADVDGDGKTDVVAADQSANLYVFRGNGSLLFRMTPRTFFGTSPNAATPVVADVTGDGTAEILVGVGTEIAVVSKTGVQLTDDGVHDGRPSYFLPTATSGAVVTDLDGDGKVDVVAGSGTPFPSAADGLVQVWVPGGNVGPVPWPAFRQDPALRRGVSASPGLCPALPPWHYYSIPPCRLVDTRNAAGPLGGPALQPGATRDFTLTGTCGVPAEARTLAANVTVTGTTSFGDLRVYPAGASGSTASTINWSVGQTRANNTILQMNVAGTVTIWSVTAGPVHAIVDVFGYFR